MAKNSKQARLNIYLDSAEMRRRIKMRAAEEDISISEYCRRVLTAHLSEEGEGNHSVKRAVRQARLFQTKTLGGKTFRVSSADLIREARENR